MEDPRSLFAKVLRLIAYDIDRIDEIQGEHGRLTHETALDLCRYSKALLDIVRDRDTNDDDERKRLSKLTMDELVELADESVKKFRHEKTSGKKEGAKPRRARKDDKA